MTLTYITQFRLGDPAPLHVDLLEYDQADDSVSRRTLAEADRVDDVGEDFEIIGLAEDYADPATVWLVAEHIHSDAWAVREVTDGLEPGELAAGLREGE